MPQDILVTASTGAKKADGNKLRMDLIPVSAINDLADILTFGAQKYDDRNWEQGFPFGRVYAALQRHLTAWWGGEDLDPESGRSHLSHALCNIAFLNEFRTTHPELDDRSKRGANDNKTNP